MEIHFKITTNTDQTFDIKSNYADVIALEEKFEMDASDLILRQRATWLGYLAWHALHRTNQVPDDYETFKLSIAQLETISKTEGKPKAKGK